MAQAHHDWLEDGNNAQFGKERKMWSLIYDICFVYRPISLSLFSSVFFILLKAWLTEIHEYAQKDVVIMLLGNKVSKASFFVLHKKIRRITGPLPQY